MIPIETHFAPAERSSNDELLAQVQKVSLSPLMDGVLKTAGGLVAVLNEHRQILAVNQALLKSLGIQNSQDVLGLRPGEALRCSHAADEPGGCGTAEACATCGAAIAIVTSQAESKPVEQKCAVQVTRDGVEQDLYLAVRAAPVELDGSRLVLLYLQDITAEQQWAALERVFFHDIRNTISGMVGLSHLLCEGAAPGGAAKLRDLALRLAQELEVQRCLSQRDTRSFRPLTRVVTASELINELKALYAAHPAARGKTLHFRNGPSDVSFKTDFSLVMRVAGNMIVNALEATPTGGEARVWIQSGPNTVVIAVWNAQHIAPSVAKRVFQRNFSTKGGFGRGLGTFSMKMLGEKFLGGKVEFDTSETEGTVFRLTLPA
ncbi:MAG TPA: HAMP domain-containing sensor histidine kinase [Candidatus Brocadiia bacterium]|nr:HAMP domain-containing sensor histidine kinase [Candidatus Brocadiia bacterium]